MSERMQLYRLIVRGVVTVIIALSLIVGMFLLVRELPDDPDTALVAILGTVFGGLATALGYVVNAISTNPDRKDGSD